MAFLDSRIVGERCAGPARRYPEAGGRPDLRLLATEAVAEGVAIFPLAGACRTQGGTALLRGQAEKRQHLVLYGQRHCASPGAFHQRARFDPTTAMRGCR